MPPLRPLSAGIRIKANSASETSRTNARQSREVSRHDREFSDRIEANFPGALAGALPLRAQDIASRQKIPRLFPPMLRSSAFSRRYGITKDTLSPYWGKTISMFWRMGVRRPSNISRMRPIYR